MSLALGHPCGRTGDGVSRIDEVNTDEKCLFLCVRVRPPQRGRGGEACLAGLGAAPLCMNCVVVPFGCCSVSAPMHAGDGNLTVAGAKAFQDYKMKLARSFGGQARVTYSPESPSPPRSFFVFNEDTKELVQVETRSAADVHASSSVSPPLEPKQRP